MSEAGGIHILFIDDEPDFAEVAADILEREDDRFVVETATRASEGLDRLAETDIDCIVTDYEMPHQNGIEFLETVRKEHPDLPFIVYTGKGSEEVASEAMAAGVTDYIPKGNITDQSEILVTRIRNAVDRARGQRDRRRHLNAMETAQEGISILDSEGKFVYVNQAYADLYGYTLEDLVGEHWELLYRPEDIPQIRDEILPTAEAEGHWHGETTGVRADGSTFIEEHTLATTSDGELFCTVRDITERKNREQKLTALNDVADVLTASESIEEVCERTIDASNDILDFDMSLISIEDGGVLTPVAVSDDISPTEMTDMPVDNGIAGKTYRSGESFLIDDVSEHEDADPQGPYKSLISLPVGDHGNFQAAHRSIGAFDESDLELAELLISHTASALDRLSHEEQLQHETDRLEEFASVVSHDLRNPMNVAQGRLELARDDCDSDHLDEAALAVERSLTLIDDLLSLAREGERISDVESVPLADIVDGCWQNVETSTATLVTATDRTIRADRSRLQQLLENLFRNAIEHAGEDVTVTVGDLAEGDGFYVADDGPGIPAAKRDKVFEPGYSTSDGGTGFGLNIVQEIANAHGWEITVTDSETGGARFEITGIGSAAG